MKSTSTYNFIIMFGFSVIASAMGLNRVKAPRATEKIRSVQDSLEKVATDDKKSFEDSACWCKKNLAKNNQLVESLRQQTDQLGYDIQGQTAAKAQLTADLENQQRELESNQQALDTAKSLRERDSKKFADDEQQHIQSIKALDGALGALKKGSVDDLSLAAVRSAVHRSSNHSIRGLLVQLDSAAKHTSTPAVVYGTLKQMRHTFSDNLEDMRRDESSASEQHEGLVTAKAEEIAAIKRQITTKKTRAADVGVDVEQKKEQQDRTQKLLDAQVKLLQGIQDFCAANEPAFQDRQGKIQEAGMALQSVQVDIAGAQLLSVAKQEPVNQGAMELCIVAAGMTGDLREPAKQACKRAKEGKSQDAADAVEDLETTLKEVLSAAVGAQEKCQASVREEQNALAEKEAEVSSQKGAVSSDKDTTSATIKEVQDDIDSAQSAKEALDQVSTVTKKVLATCHFETHQDMVLLRDAKSAVPEAAKAKIGQAMNDIQIIDQTMETFVANTDEKVAKITSSLDDVTRAANKLLVPLKLIYANDEEKVIAVKDQSDEIKRDARPECDTSSLAAKAEKLKGQIAELGKISETLAFEALR